MLFPQMLLREEEDVVDVVCLYRDDILYRVQSPPEKGERLRLEVQCRRPETKTKRIMLKN